MKSVTVRIVGGLGNQLNGYAFGRAIAFRNKAALYLDADSGYWGDLYGRQYLLDKFPKIRAQRLEVPARDRLARTKYKMGIRVRAALSSSLPLRYRPVVVEERPCRFQRELMQVQFESNPYFMGYWGSYRYHECVADDLRNELRIPSTNHPLALEMLYKIRSRPSCFVHWRSYMEEKGISHPDLSRYYREAMRLVTLRQPTAHFFIFSDDIRGAQQTISPNSRNVTFVDLGTTGDVESLIDFSLMCECDHAVIGDSTFSWWAAWLQERQGKIVVAPKESLTPWGRDWTPPTWSLI